MTHLSVNINKVATLRNARGENIPDVVRFAVDCERFGAQGITVHPRPDERHITRRDVYDLRKVVTTEFNIEGYPTDDFMRMVIEVAPDYDQKDSQGFINLWGLPDKVQALREQGKL